MRSSRPTDDAESLRVLAHISSLVGHQLINAFSAVVSSAENLRMSGGGANRADRADLTEVISQVSINASAVARRLIAISRDITSPEDVVWDLPQLVKETCEELRLGFPSGEMVEFSYDLQPLAPMTARESDLRWMVREIATNAVESYSLASRLVRVSTRTDDRGWSFVVFQDSGSGMDATTLEHAFDPFFTTKPGREGLGLSVAHSIWRRHRGSIRTQSELGRGTQFELMRPPESSSLRERDQALSDVKSALNA